MNKIKIGGRLRTLRGKKTQREVADFLKISPSAMSMYEKGERIPRDDLKKKIAKYYNREVGEIFFT